MPSSWLPWPSSSPASPSAPPVPPAPATPSSSSKEPHNSSDADDAFSNALNDLRSRLTTLTEGSLSSLRLSDSPAPLIAGAVVLSAFTTFGIGRIYRRYFRRLRTVDWITPDMLGGKRWIRGVVTSVGDADNFRLYHTPGFGWRWPIKFRHIPNERKELKEETIHIRMAGVDAPEAPHFGKPGQPGADEALAWLKSAVLGKTLWCQLLKKDQYHRVVGLPTLAPRVLPGTLFRGRAVPLEMLRAGWATTYTQAGAEYGPYGLEAYLAIEREARAARRGLWKGGANPESPAAYKKRVAEGSDAPPEEAKKASKSTRGPIAGLLRLLGLRK